METEIILKLYEDKIIRFRRSHSRRYEKIINSIISYITGESDEKPVLKRADYMKEIVDILAPFHKWTFVDRRIVDCIVGEAWFWKEKDYLDQGFHKGFFKWIKSCVEENDSEDLFINIANELTQRGIEEYTILDLSITELNKVFLINNKASSVGNYILSKYPKKKKKMFKMSSGQYYRAALNILLIKNSLDEVENRLPYMLFEGEDDKGSIHAPHKELEVLCGIDSEKYKDLILRAVKETTCKACKAHLSVILNKFYGTEFKEKALELSIEVLDHISEKRNSDTGYNFRYAGDMFGIDRTGDYINWLLSTFGPASKKIVSDYILKTKVIIIEIIDSFVTHFGPDSVETAKKMFSISAGSDENIIDYYSKVFKVLEKSDVFPFENELWKLSICDVNDIKNGAAQALAKVGDSLIPKAQELLKSKNKEERDGAAKVLSYLNSEDSIKILKELSEKEKNDDLRDVMIGSLAKDKITLMEAKNLISSALSRKKLSKPVKKWLDESQLPKLKWLENGEELTVEEVRYLFYRQNREKNIQPETEVKGVYSLIDKRYSGEFANILFDLIMDNGGVYAKNRFALTLVGILGGDEQVGRLEEIVKKKKNKNGLKLLGLIGTNSALRAITGVMRHFRAKAPGFLSSANEVFNQVAEERNTGFYELADSIIPDFGFSGLYKELVIDGESFKVVLTDEFKFNYINEKNKRTKTIPKAASKELKDEMKNLAKEVKVIAKETIFDFEQYLVVRRKWDNEKWQNLFLINPLLFVIAPDIIWGVYENDILNTSFRLTEEGRFIDINNNETELPKGDIGIVHPIELGDDLGRWKEHLIENKINQPFQQLEREFFHLDSNDYDKTFYHLFDGKEIEMKLMKSRTSSFGWRPADYPGWRPGEMYAFNKAILETEVFISYRYLDDENDDKIALKQCYFTIPNPINSQDYQFEVTFPDDERLIKLKDVPGIVFSEMIRDLTEITR